MLTVTKRQRIENVQDLLFEWNNTRFIVFFHRALHCIHNEKAWISSFPCCGGLTFAIRLPNWEALLTNDIALYSSTEKRWLQGYQTDILIYSDLSSLLNPACFFLKWSNFLVVLHGPTALWVMLLNWCGGWSSTEKFRDAWRQASETTDQKPFTVLPAPIASRANLERRSLLRFRLELG